jgi:signal transduction histidine kinase
MNRIFGSIYLRFISALLGAFLLSMIISGIAVNFIQTPSIVENVDQMVETKAVNLKQLIEKHGLTLNEGVAILETKDISIQSFASLDETGLVLSEDEIKAAKNGEVVSRTSSSLVEHGYSVFQIDNKWVLIHPDAKNSPTSIFLSLQFILIGTLIIAGIILIFLATITVVRPIKKISNASKHVASGDLTVKIKPSGGGELRELIDNFNNMIKSLSANEYLHKEFVSNVSHEFITPITSLKGYAKLLKRKNIIEEQRQEYADIIIYESDRLSNLSADLLRLAELENEESIVTKEQFFLDEQIRDALVLLQNKWEKKQIQIDLEMDEVSFNGDKALMYQVWINLFSNAIKYTDENGQIKIKLRQDDRIIVEIIDNGMGVSPEDLDRIFLRFYKSDKSRNSPGTGLGLSIVKKIVELHGGTITVENLPDRGSKFVIKL